MRIQIDYDREENEIESTMASQGGVISALIRGEEIRNLYFLKNVTKSFQERQN